MDIFRLSKFILIISTFSENCIRGGCVEEYWLQLSSNSKKSLIYIQMFITPPVYISFSLTNANAGTSGSSKDKVQYNHMVDADLS